MSAKSLLVLQLTALVATALPCAFALNPNDVVSTRSEYVVIAWNPAKKMQHFVRYAAFESSAKDFGFLVPTPTEPELSEASERAFELLEQQVENQNKGMRAAAAGVEVRFIQKVGSLDAAVLRATDARALAAWLKLNGYPSRPELMRWVDHYVRSKWFITAYKYGNRSEPQQIVAQAVRMSFNTDRPIYPYREPKDVAVGDYRRLRVHLVAPTHMSARLQNGEPWDAGGGPIKQPISQVDRKKLAEYLKLDIDELPFTMLQTTFEDDTKRRPDSDVEFFAEPSSKAPLFVLAGIAAFSFVMALRRESR